MNLRYVVLTSVDRDDLPDGGAEHYARCIQAIRARCPDTLIEALTPDFAGSESAVATLTDSGVDVFAQNLETVRRLTHPRARPPRRLPTDPERAGTRQVPQRRGDQDGIDAGPRRNRRGNPPMPHRHPHPQRGPSNPWANTSSPPPTTSQSPAGCIPTSSPATESGPWKPASPKSPPAPWCDQATEPMNLRVGVRSGQRTSGRDESWAGSLWKPR